MLFSLVQLDIGTARIFSAGGRGCALFFPQKLVTFLVVVLNIQVNLKRTSPTLQLSPAQ